MNRFRNRWYRIVWVLIALLALNARVASAATDAICGDCCGLPTASCVAICEPAGVALDAAPAGGAGDTVPVRARQAASQPALYAHDAVRVADVAPPPHPRSRRTVLRL